MFDETQVEEDDQLEEPDETPEEEVVEEEVGEVVDLTVEELINQVIAGEWGKGQERRRRLRDAGYDHIKVQKELVRRANRR